MTLFITGVALCIYVLRRYGALTPLKVSFIVAVIFLSNVFLSKMILEQYIESVAYKKFDKKIDAHIQMNILSNHKYMTDNHAAIDHEEFGFMIWSFKERGFIKYKMRTGW